MNTNKKTSKIIFNIFSILIIAILVCFAFVNVYFSIKTMVSKDFDFFGYSFIIVSVDDLAPRIEKDSLCIYKKNNLSLSEQQIIVYKSNDQFNLGIIDTINEDNIIVLIAENTKISITRNSIEGVYVKTSNLIRSIINFCTSSYGKIILIATPISLLVVYLAISRYKERKYYKTDTEDDINKSTENKKINKKQQGNNKSATRKNVNNTPSYYLEALKTQINEEKKQVLLKKTTKGYEETKNRRK